MKEKESAITKLTDQQRVETHKRMMSNAKTTGPKNCKVVNLTPTKEKGYAQAFVKGSTTKVLAHVLSFWISKGSFDPTDGKDISHLCHNPLCVNPDHLVREDKEINQRRKGCVGTVTCPCGCRHEFSVCNCSNQKCL